MNILIYVNPFVTHGELLFFEGALKNKLLPQARLLSRDGKSVSLVAGEMLVQKISDQLEGINVIPISNAQLIRAAGSLADRQFDFYTAPDGNVAVDYGTLLKGVIDRVPDVIIAWETPVPFLRRLFPNSLILHEMPGMVSRAPYPETFTVDPEGLFRQGLLYRESGAVKGYEASDAEFELAQRFITEFRSAIDTINPFPRRALDPAGRFDRLMLLPLQVSEHYAFRADTGYRSQMEMMVEVMESVPENVGVVVTQYVTPRISDRPLNAETLENLRQRYPNLIHLPEFDRLDSISQYLLSSVDAVCTASSSVGFQALMWQRPVIVPRETYLSPWANASGLTRINWSDLQDTVPDPERILAFMLGRYQPLASAMLEDGRFMNALVDEMAGRFQDGARSFDLLPRFHELDGRYTDRMLAMGKIERAIEQVGSKFGQVDKEIADLREFESAVSSPDVSYVSFDIFDTLLDRPLEAPTHLFQMIEQRVEQVTNGKIRTYAASRVASEQAARARAQESGRQEITLDEIYDGIASLHDLEPGERAAAMAEEVSAEKALLSPREHGRRLFDIARRRGKRIVIISDMYMPQEFIEDVLTGAGYSGYWRLYLSSTIGLRKHEGDLYDHVAQDLGVPAQSILHVGDNAHGDVKMARERGVKPWAIERASVRIMRNSRFKALYEEHRRSRPLGESVMVGLAAKRFFDSPHRRFFNETHFNQNPFALGYMAAGPMFAAFALWLRQQARQDGIETLCFLARDGHVVKGVFDKLFAGDPDAPTTCYAYASRRAARVASICCRSDILEIVESKIARATVGSLLLSKFGIDPQTIEADTLDAAGIGSLDEVVDDATGRARIRALVLLLEARILENAATERTLLREHFQSLGVVAGRRTAIVDIGYAGTMQAALKGILGLGGLPGYYFITFDTARRVATGGEIVRGFAGDFVDQKTYNHPICRHGLLFETIFCNTDRSFNRFIRRPDGALEPQFQRLPADGARQRLIEQIHLGALALASDIERYFGQYIDTIHLDPCAAVRVLTDYIQLPSGRDAELFEGVQFEDSFGGAGVRYIVPPRALMQQIKTIETKCVWREGTSVFIRRPDVQALIKGKSSEASAAKNLPARSNGQIPVSAVLSAEDTEVPKTARMGRSLLRIEKTLIQRLCGDRKYRKYLRDRERFFADANLLVLRWYGRALA